MVAFRGPPLPSVPSGGPRCRTAPSCTHLPAAAYTTLPDKTPVCRLIPPLPPSTPPLHTMLDHGFHTFTTPATRLPQKPPPQLLTRMSIHPEEVPRVTTRTVARFVDSALTALAVDRLHMLQLSWRDHRDSRFVDFLGELGELRRQGKVRSIGVADFPTDSIRALVSAGVRVASIQVPFSVVDTRPNVQLLDFCARHGIAVLASGALVGGLINERFLGVPEPRGRRLRLVRAWGGWSLLQEVLYAFKTIADRHEVTMANVAVRWALDRGVSAVVIGGGVEYAESNVRAFEFEMCEEDHRLLEHVSSRGNDLYSILGDCGKEAQAR